MSERMDVADKTLQCRACGDGFIFTSGEQELFRLRGITTEPVRCSNCAHGRVLAVPAHRRAARAPR